MLRQTRQTRYSADPGSHRIGGPGERFRVDDETGASRYHLLKYRTLARSYRRERYKFRLCSHVRRDLVRAQIGRSRRFPAENPHVADPGLASADQELTPSADARVCPAASLLTPIK